MSIQWLHLVIFGLAAFRLTRLIVDDLIMEWLRRPFTTIRVEQTEDGETEEWIEPNGFIGEGLTCQWCVGVWSSLIILVLYTFIPFGEYVVLLLAIAGLQSILYSWSVRT
ncbi:DUF1360 domain-containing protein [Halobacillus salinus]|uniref:DUF1360 domain-containing protein n=1 Tax=Halobacillus salinus TaxID=192814 RepID=A0A4Z0H449_9BACI|nr:DUF1360 domain-containing protein [Halobacillus salinus]TGB05198.1 DUF1360 domain-containing protein [Halobacillus salinus]